VALDVSFSQISSRQKFDITIDSKCSAGAASRAQTRYTFLLPENSAAPLARE
jgi:hypothetical protein